MTCHSDRVPPRPTASRPRSAVGPFDRVPPRPTGVLTYTGRGRGHGAASGSDAVPSIDTLGTRSWHPSQGPRATPGSHLRILADPHAELVVASERLTDTTDRTNEEF